MRSSTFLARICPPALSLGQPSLPSELLYDIVSLCDRPSLRQLCLADSVLREIASPLLYRSLSFRHPTQAEAFLHPVRLNCSSVWLNERFLNADGDSPLASISPLALALPNNEPLSPSIGQSSFTSSRTTNHTPSWERLLPTISPFPFLPSVISI
jgi:hypothetical protein